MDHLEGKLDKNTLKLMREKWGLDDEEDEARASFTATVLENQSKHLQRLAEEMQAVNIGSWVKDLFPALKSALMTHPLYNLCSMQAITGPIGIVYYYRTRMSGVAGATSVDENGVEKKVIIPSVRLDIDPVTITAQPRKVKSFLNWSEGSTMGMVIEELLTEVSREIIWSMLDCVTDDSDNYIADGDDLKEQLDRASHLVHRKSQRAPANRIVANTEMLAKLGIECPEASIKFRALTDFDGKKVFLDPLFPKGRLLTWYHGDNPLDAGIIYSPYIPMEITHNFVDPNDMGLRRVIRTRHKITLVRPEFSYLIKAETS